MRIVTTASGMSEFAASAKAGDSSVGFVPTMGALHPGHVSLVRRAKKDNDAVAVSVFVNPAQFNDPDDLKRYPRTFEQDRETLEQQGVDVLFCPSEEEMYPPGTPTEYDLDGLDRHMEGKHRTGHFNGVVRAVTRFFGLVQPTRAYFGEKDFQQLAIIMHMTDKLGYDVEIVGCPTLREPNGLAMSSRNMNLSKSARTKAACIYANLRLLKENLKRKTLHEALKESEGKLNHVENLVLEYLELVDPITLIPVDGEGGNGIQACVAAKLDGVRLIDNLRVK